MKKVILMVVMVFATSGLVNASTGEISEEVFNDCAAKTYAYGTKHGGGNAELEYALTDAYYAGCMEAQ